MAEILDKAADEAASYSSANDMLAGRMSSMVKGVGFAHPGGNKALDDPQEIMRRSFEAETSIRKATKSGIANPAGVAKGMNPAFSSQFGNFLGQGSQSNGMSTLVNEVQSALSDLGKNVTLTSPLSTGFVPFDLVAPSRLIYPVYSPLRNKVPRVQGQGTSRQAKVITGISGSQTGSGTTGNVKDLSISEAASFTGWNNIPNAGAQSAVDINVPYRFYGLSESLSWLAQFSGQGFEDVSALANLILLQEFMMMEEYSMIAGTSVALSTAAAPTVAARVGGTGEVPISGATTNVYVIVAATNYYGEGVGSAVSAAAAVDNATKVVDVTIAPVAGAHQYNVYVGTGASAPALSGFWFKAAVGGSKFTIQGALPTSGTSPQGSAHPLAVDGGTSGANREEGMLSVISGHSANGSIYPSGWQGGYVNQSVGSHLSASVLNNALQGMWDGAGAFRADPDELIAEGSDIMRLSNDVVSQGGATNYRLFVEQDELAGVTAGAAVSQFQNPITRKIVKIVVHPWLTQGTAMLQSYTLPFSWSNVQNVWEKTVVQDYLSVSWPVIDPTFRYSMFMYGSLVCNAPQYTGLLQGLQVSDVTPFS